MGAMHNDLERCQFMYTDDRRCRNLIESPTSQLCCYHNKAAQKKADRPESNPATDAFFDWLSNHALDTAAHINQAMNQVFLLTVADRISARKADSLTRMLRLMLKSVPDVRDEYKYSAFRTHAPGGERFLSEIRPTVLATMQRDSDPGVLAENPPPQAASPVPEFTPSEVEGPSVVKEVVSPSHSHPSPAPSVSSALKEVASPAPVAAAFRPPAVAPDMTITTQAGRSPEALRQRLHGKAASSRRTPKSPAAAGDVKPGDLKPATRHSPALKAPSAIEGPLATDSSISSALKRLPDQAIMANVREILRSSLNNPNERRSPQKPLRPQRPLR